MSVRTHVDHLDVVIYPREIDLDDIQSESHSRECINRFVILYGVIHSAKYALHQSGLSVSYTGSLRPLYIVDLYYRIPPIRDDDQSREACSERDSTEGCATCQACSDRDSTGDYISAQLLFAEQRADGHMRIIEPRAQLIDQPSQYFDLRDFAREFATGDEFINIPYHLIPARKLVLLNFATTVPNKRCTLCGKTRTYGYVIRPNDTLSSYDDDAPIGTVYCCECFTEYGFNVTRVERDDRDERGHEDHVEQSGKGERPPATNIISNRELCEISRDSIDGDSIREKFESLAGRWIGFGREIWGLSGARSNFLKFMNQEHKVIVIMTRIDVQFILLFGHHYYMTFAPLPACAKHIVAHRERVKYGDPMTSQ